MISKTEILDTELRYASEFSSAAASENCIRFTNSALPDMHYHNFIFIQPVSNDQELIRLIEAELSTAKKSGVAFLMIVVFQKIADGILKKISVKSKVSYSEYYIFNDSKLDGHERHITASVSKVDSAAAVNDVTSIKVEQYGMGGKKDFWTKVTKRKGEIYLSQSNLDSYVCYNEQGRPVGNCDLYIDNKMAKIEDFDIITSEQRKGYGTLLLKTLINEALHRGATTIYLVAGADNTAKKMYQKMGFHKFHEQTDLFWDLSGNSA